MNVFSYKLEHDYGLAPNPFGGICTLAVCKSQIRNNPNLTNGDWVVGLGSKALGNFHHLIYAMQVEEKISFNEYWKDKRFDMKKPVINGSLVQMYGDNFYHFDEKSNEWIQENSAHSLEGGAINAEHLKRDTGGEYVLISRRFYYFGNKSPLIPNKFTSICSEGRGHKYLGIDEHVKNDFIRWLTSSHTVGLHGDPISWNIHL